MTQEPAAKADRDAIILIPGLLHEPGDMIKAAGEKIRAALDTQASTPKARFLLRESKTENYPGSTTHVQTIERQVDSRTTFSIDLYELSYEDTLIKKYKDRKPIVQALSLGWLLGSQVTKIKQFYKTPAKTTRQKWQIIWASCSLALLVIYMVILLTAGVATLDQAIDLHVNFEPLIASFGALKAKFGPLMAKMESWVVIDWSSQEAYDNLLLVYNFLRSIYDSLLPGGLTSLIVLITALGLFTTTSLKQWISDVSVWLISAITYLSVGDRRSALTGKVSTLLEYIEEKVDVEYRQVHIVAYSFGSIIAIDAMYPTSPPSERNSKVDKLITFGCPFDFVRTFWSDYFKQRMPLEKRPEWRNIYASIDVLASNFKDEDKNEKECKSQGVYTIHDKGKPSVCPQSVLFGPNVSLSDYSLLQQITLIGFKVHLSYWGDPESYARSCFDLIVKCIYQDDPVLS